jgi:uncharacterized RDD family membrane protein YckC
MANYPFPKASLKHRLGTYLVEIGLFLVTLGIGYCIWFLIILGQGQTPGKQILKLRVYDATTGSPARWGHMFIRELGLFFVLAIFAYGLPIVIGLQSLNELVSQEWSSFGIGEVIYYGVFLVDAFWIFKEGKRQRLVDVICKTDVLYEAAMPVQTKGTLNISS